MTTKFLDEKICTFKILLSWRFPRKTAFLDEFPLCPQNAQPPQKRKFYFYCRLAVSERKRFFCSEIEKLLKNWVLEAFPYFSYSFFLYFLGEAETNVFFFFLFREVRKLLSSKRAGSQA